MENRKISRMGARALILIAGILIAAFALASPRAARAQCMPPSCRDDGGGGSQPPVPPQPPAPDPPPDPGDPGNPGDPGDPGNPPPDDPGDPGGGDGGGGGSPPQPEPSPPNPPPPAPPLPPGELDPAPIDPGEVDQGTGLGTYTDYTCGIIGFCPEMADFTIYTPPDSTSGGFILSWSCRTFESCASTGEPGDDGLDPPCEPTISDGGVELECAGDGEHGFDWGWYIQVWASIPPHRVKRTPFPRGMVTVENKFDLLAEPWISESGGPRFDGTGFWSETVNIPDPIRAEPEPGDLKDYEIGVRWRRVGDQYPGFGAVPPHCFDFDEREWNLAAGSPPAACGVPEGDGHVRVTHSYETASWGKPPNGPRADLERGIVPDLWDLESYQVRVPTYWVVEWRDRWYEWAATGEVEWGECGCWGPPGEPKGEPYRRGCTPPPGICVNPGEWYGQVGDPKYDWVLHDTDWYGLDLRDYGWPTWYETSYSVISGGEFAGREWWNDPSPNVPTPIIEVQSVLEP